MVGQLGHRGTDAALEGQADPAVQPEPGGGGQLLVEGGADQGMGEGVEPGPARAGRDQVGPLGLLDGLQGSFRTTVQRVGQEAHLELPADDRGGGQPVVGGRGEPGQAPAHHLPDAFGQAHLGQRADDLPAPVRLGQRPRLDEMADHLAQHDDRAGDERVTEAVHADTGRPVWRYDGPIKPDLLGGESPDHAVAEGDRASGALLFYRATRDGAEIDVLNATTAADDGSVEVPPFDIDAPPGVYTSSQSAGFPAW